MNVQNWNKLIMHVKRHLGVPLNFLELTDDDIKDIIESSVLPAFSQYVGRAVWFKLGPEHVLGVDNASTPDVDEGTFIDATYTNYYIAERYKIPVPEDMYIVDVQELYWPQYFTGAVSGANADLIQSMGMLSINPMDTAIMNVYSDIHKSLMMKIHHYHHNMKNIEI